MGRAGRRAAAVRLPDAPPEVAVQHLADPDLRRAEAAQNLLVAELNRLLEPASEFVKLAIANIETRRVTDKVVEDWKPVLANAINEWRGSGRLTAVLDSPGRSEPRPGAEAARPAGGSRRRRRSSPATRSIRRLLGPSRPVAYEDTVTYFKIHLAERYTWVMCRLYLGRKRPSVWVPLPQEQVQAMAPGLMLSTPQDGWTCITLNASGEIERLGDILRAAWDSQKAIRTRKPESSEVESPGSEGNGVADGPEPAIVPVDSGSGDVSSETFGG